MQSGPIHDAHSRRKDAQLDLNLSTGSGAVCYSANRRIHLVYYCLLAFRIRTNAIVKIVRRPTPNSMHPFVTDSHVGHGTTGGHVGHGHASQSEGSFSAPPVLVFLSSSPASGKLATS